VKMEVKHYDAEARKFLANLKTHKEDPDRREVVGQITVESRGRQFVRNIRDGDVLDIEAVQREVQTLHTKRRKL